MNLFFILLCCGAEVAQAQGAKGKHDPVQGTSLQRLVELAEARSPLLEKQRGLYESARLSSHNALAEQLPKLDLEAIQGYSGSSPRDPYMHPRPLASNLNLVASENLYDNGANITKYRMALRRLERAKLEYELARDQQLLNVANSYFDWSQSLQQREILENKRDLLRKQFNVLQAQYLQGLKLKRDVLRIETELRRLDLDVLNSDNEIDLNFQKLASFVGVNRDELEKELIIGEDVKPIVPAESSTAWLKAEDHRQAKIFALSEQEAGFATELVRREHWPTVFINGAVGSHIHDYIDNQPNSFDVNHNWDWSALLTIRYNIWDSGIRMRNVQIAHISETTIQNQDRQALFDLNNDLRGVVLQLRAFRENVKMTRELLVLEQQSYAILESEYRNGRASYLDLITNLNSLIDARSKYMISYFGLKKQQALYFFHQGNLYENIKQK